MKNYCDYFYGKKITVMGLGVLGRGVNIAKFLAECGVDLTVTDLKNEKELKPSLAKLKKFKNIKYVLGGHKLTDFCDKDFIVKAGGVPLNSPYIAEAKKNGIAIEMDESLFVKLAEGIVVIGITGTKGKSITAQLIFEILKANESYFADKKRAYLGGNVKGQATLPLLKKVKLGDIVVMELDSWRLQGFNDSKISPHISVFTSFMPDHLNYYNNDLSTAQAGIKQYFYDKAGIFKYQKEGDFLILGEQFLSGVKKLGLYNSLEEFITLLTTTRRVEKEIKGKVILTGKKDIPENWKIKILGAHNLENIAAAIVVCRSLKVKEPVIKKIIENFKGIPGRLEFIKEIKGVRFYNDTTATTPEGTIAAFTAFQNYRGKIILLGGGSDKNLDYKEYARAVKKYVKTLILFQGAASDKIAKELKVKETLINLTVRPPSLDIKMSKSKSSVLQKTLDKFIFFTQIKSMREAVGLALKNAEKGDIVLLSPGAASFGVFKNEFDRGEQFNRIVKRSKLQAIA